MANKTLPNTKPVSKDFQESKVSLSAYRTDDEKDTYNNLNNSGNRKLCKLYPIKQEFP